MKKVLGLILLLGGLAVIIYGLYSSYNIFSAKTSPPEIFVAEKGKTVLPGSQDLQAQMEKLIQEQLKGILPANSITQLLNLISWSIFAGILFIGGGQIAGLGVKLLK